jgi:hypothetical protein
VESKGQSGITNVESKGQSEIINVDSRAKLDNKCGK